MMKRFALSSLAVIAATPATAATDLTLSANLTGSCALAVTNNGTMTASAAGTSLSSENAGGSSAIMTLVAIGAAPTVSFTAPSLTTSPAGWSASPTLQIKYTSIGGANQAYTSSASSYTPSGLLDTITLHGKVNSSTGFASGNYVLRTTVTCS